VSTPRRRRGRPTDPLLDDQILDACFSLLSEVGYARLSVEAVAGRAGVTRPTVYRRWASKQNLVVASLARAQSGIEQLPDTGDLERDLVAHLRSLHQTLSRPFGMAIIGTMLAEEHTTPELLAGFRDKVVKDRRAAFQGLFRRADPGADDERLTLLVDLAVGAFYARYIAGQPFGADWAEQVAVHIVGVGHRVLREQTDP
jgi:AcrR family transcriptional regulator